MIRPIVAYGDAVLRQPTDNIPLDYPGLAELIDDMFETMYAASGVGLAAPQIGLPIRLFVMDTTEMSARNPQETEALKGFKLALINPKIIDETGDEWGFEEGCLSIPGIRETVSRKPNITIQYQTLEGETRTETYDGLRARVMQHEHDHLEGVLFVDYAKPLRKQLLRNKLLRISRGGIEADYPMRFAQGKRVFS
jgi:peptide deformylase